MAALGAFGLSVRSWAALDGYGQFWTGLDGFWWLFASVGGSGPLWAVLGGSACLALGGHRRL
jgi:hypothetical protein